MTMGGSKGNVTRITLCLASLVVILLSSLPSLTTARSRDSKGSKLKATQLQAFQDEYPVKCPAGEHCQEQSGDDPDSPSSHRRPNAPLRHKGLSSRQLTDTREDNHVISLGEMERPMNDAPASVTVPGTSPPPSRSKSQGKTKNKADTRLKRKNRRKNRRKKCRQKQRKRKLTRKGRKGKGKRKKAGKGMLKRKGEKVTKGKKNRNKKCGRRHKRKDRKRKKNGRKGSKGKLNIGSGIDTPDTTNDTLNSISKDLRSQLENRFNAEFLRAEQEGTKTEESASVVNSGVSSAEGNKDSQRIEAAVNNIDSNKGVVEDAETLSNSEPKFNAIQITALFEKALRSDPKGNKFVLLDNYIKAYKRLASVFSFFGVIFSFAKSDLEDKIRTLEKLRQASIEGQYPKRYHSFKSMFDYEYSNGIALPGGKAASGVRENAWIHRALRFIIAIIRSVADKTDTSSLSSRVQTFYTEILAPHHSWIVRMGVYAAIHSFPSRETLLKDMNITDDSKGMQELTRLAESIQAVYDSVQVHYEKHAPPK